jgi:hypothetical protein
MIVPTSDALTGRRRAEVEIKRVLESEEGNHHPATLPPAGPDLEVVAGRVTDGRTAPYRSRKEFR